MNNQPKKDEAFLTALNAALQKRYANWLDAAAGCLKRRARKRTDIEPGDLVAAAYRTIVDNRTYDGTVDLDTFVFNVIDSLAKDLTRDAWARKKNAPSERHDGDPRKDVEDVEPPASDRNASTTANPQSAAEMNEQEQRYEQLLGLCIEYFGEGSVEATYIGLIREGASPDELAAALGVDKAEIGRIADRVEYRLEQLEEQRNKEERKKALAASGKKKS